jgi:hypothetical protein
MQRCVNYEEVMSSFRDCDKQVSVYYGHSE